MPCLPVAHSSRRYRVSALIYRLRALSDTSLDEKIDLIFPRSSPIAARLKKARGALKNVPRSYFASAPTRWMTRISWSTRGPRRACAINYRVTITNYTPLYGQAAGKCLVGHSRRLLYLRGFSARMPCGCTSRRRMRGSRRGPSARVEPLSRGFRYLDSRITSRVIELELF